MGSFWSSIIGILVGAVITWFFARYYYKKAGKELLEEAAELRKLLNAMLILQQNKEGVYTPKLDEEGKLLSITANMSATIEGSSSLTANLSTKDNS